MYDLADEDAMSQNHLPFGLALMIGVSFGGGAAFIMWRTLIAIRSGSIWLRGQKVIRHEEPTLFWAYMTVYLILFGVMFYGVVQSVTG